MADAKLLDLVVPGRWGGASEALSATSICLAQGLAKIGKNVALALREPSLGPTFGLKGGAVGGGLAKVVPSADINMHFTGDLHRGFDAITPEFGWTTNTGLKVRCRWILVVVGCGWGR